MPRKWSDTGNFCALVISSHFLLMSEVDRTWKVTELIILQDVSKVLDSNFNKKEIIDNFQAILCKIEENFSGNFFYKKKRKKLREIFYKTKKQGLKKR